MVNYHHHIDGHTVGKMMDLMSECLDVRDIPEFKRCVIKMQELFDHHHSFCVFTNMQELANKKNPMVEIVDVSYPKGLLDHYFDTAYNTEDPVTKELFKTGTVQNWDNAFKKNNIPYPEWGRDLGIHGGYTYASFEPGYSTAANFSFNRVEKGFEKRTETIIQCMVPHLAEAMKKSLGVDKVSDIRLQSTLTLREIEILNWLKHGKSTWDISMIVKISERGVNFHVNNLKTKLGAVNRAQAVAIAMSNGMIKY